MNEVPDLTILPDEGLKLLEQDCRLGLAGARHYIAVHEESVVEWLEYLRAIGVERLRRERFSQTVP